ELLRPLAQRDPRRRRDPAAANLARLAVERLVGDLPAMHIQRDYDPHRDLLELRRQQRHRVRNTLEPRRSHYMSSLWSPVGATGGNRSQMAPPPKAQNKRKPLPWAATGCREQRMVSRASAVGCH